MLLSLKFFNLQSQVEHLEPRARIYTHTGGLEDFYTLYFVYLIINRIKCSNVPHTQKSQCFQGFSPEHSAEHLAEHDPEHSDAVF